MKQRKENISAIEGRPDLYEYQDYRSYLRDMYDHLKRTQPQFSYRYFSEKAGLSSPNYLKLIIEGERSLTLKSIQKFAEALNLNKSETTFFEALVHFNQAVGSKAKNYHYARLKQCRGYIAVKEVERDQFRYYSRWYYSAIRELVAFKNFKEDPEWIAKKIRPAISAVKAKEGLELLLRLKLIERGPSGKMLQTNAGISTSPEVRSLAVSNFHRQMLSQAAHSIDEVSPEHRDISALTLGVTKAQMAEVKKRIVEFRRSLLNDIGQAGLAPEDIYQLTIQFFPLTQLSNEKGTKK